MPTIKTIPVVCNCGRIITVPADHKRVPIFCKECRADITERYKESSEKMKNLVSIYLLPFEEIIRKRVEEKQRLHEIETYKIAQDILSADFDFKAEVTEHEAVKRIAWYIALVQSYTFEKLHDKNLSLITRHRAKKLIEESVREFNNFWDRHNILYDLDNMLINRGLFSILELHSYTDDIVNALNYLIDVIDVFEDKDTLNKGLAKEKEYEKQFDKYKMTLKRLESKYQTPKRYDIYEIDILTDEEIHWQWSEYHKTTDPDKRKRIYDYIRYLQHTLDEYNKYNKYMVSRAEENSILISEIYNALVEYKRGLTASALADLEDKVFELIWASNFEHMYKIIFFRKKICEKWKITIEYNDFAVNPLRRVYLRIDTTELPALTDYELVILLETLRNIEHHGGLLLVDILFEPEVSQDEWLADILNEIFEYLFKVLSINAFAISIKKLLKFNLEEISLYFQSILKKL